jgi:hypothetical protein
MIELRFISMTPCMSDTILFKQLVDTAPSVPARQVIEPIGTRAGIDWCGGS